MHYLYDDLRVMYTQLMTAAHNAESEYKYGLGEGAQVKLAQA